MKFKALALSTLAFVILSTPTASAEKGGKKNRGNGHEYDRQGGYGYGQAYGNGAYGLPPGLAKRGQPPPGLENHLWKHGSLPPGLQKKVGQAYYSPYPVYSPYPAYEPYPVYVPYREPHAVPQNYSPARTRIQVSLDF
jgi:hypothetical protein